MQLLLAGMRSLVHKGEPVCDSSGPIEAQVGQLQALQKPLQDVQHRGPLAEDQWVVPLSLHTASLSQRQSWNHAPTHTNFIRTHFSAAFAASVR